jgi:hypothetical protein
LREAALPPRCHCLRSCPHRRRPNGNHAHLTQTNNHELDTFKPCPALPFENMKTEQQTEYPFTVDQYAALAKEQQQALEAVADYLCSRAVPTGTDLTDAELTSIFNLMKPCEGCAPPEECDGDVLTVIRKKLGAVYEVGLEMAETELKQKNITDFSFCMVVDPSFEDATHVAIVDYHKPVCHLHEWIKPWNFTFSSLKDLADAVLSVRKRLVERITKPTELLVVMEGGVVHEIVNLPPNIHVMVIDYDVEGVENDRLEISPVDGELCVINRW